MRYHIKIGSVKKLCTLFLVFILCFILTPVVSSVPDGDILGKVSEFWWANDVGAYAVQPDSIRVGTSDYYLTVSSSAVILFVNIVGRTFKVWGSNGTIQKTVASTVILDATSGAAYPRVLWVSGNVYAVAFFKALTNRVVTFSVSSTTGAIAVIGSKDLTNNGQMYDFTRNGTSNVFVATYAKPGILGRQSLQYDKLTINNDGSFGATVTNKVINSVQGRTTVPCHVTFVNGSKGKMLFSWTRNSTTDWKGMMCTIDINGSGTFKDWWNFDSQGNYTFTFFRKGNVYCIAYQDSSLSGQIYTFELNPTGLFPSKGWIEGLTYKSGGGAKYNVILNATDSQCLITYADSLNKGNISSFPFSINSGGLGGFEKTFTFNSSGSMFNADIVQVKPWYYLVTYEGGGVKGLSCVIKVCTDTWVTLNNSINGTFRNVTRFHEIDQAFNGFFL